MSRDKMGTEKNWTVVFTAPGEVQLEERPMPELRDDCLLVRTVCSLVSIGTELTLLSGNYPPGSYWAEYGKYPFLPGYSNIGVAVAVGKSISQDWLGKRVASYSPHATFNMVTLDEARPVHEEVEAGDAAFFTIAEIVMNGIRRGRIGWGESVVVFGLGLLGQLAVRLCRYCGAERVFGIDTAAARLQLLPDVQGITALNPADQSIVEIIKELTYGRMADAAVELTGNPAALGDEAKVLHPQGRLIILSSPRGPSSFDFHDWCNYPSLEIIGAHNRSHPGYETLDNPWTKLRHGELFFSLLGSGRMVVKDLVTHQIGFEQLPEIYKALLDNRAPFMGVVVDWD